MCKKYLKSVCLFSAWTAGQQISVHSLGEGPRGAGLENRSVLDLLLGFARNIHGSCIQSDVLVSQFVSKVSHYFYHTMSFISLAPQDIKSDSLP